MEKASVDTIVAALKNLRVPALQGEYDLHFLISSALEDAGIAYRHEYSLGARRRVDFFCDGIGIEVKKGRPSPANLKKQITRYMESDEIREIVVVTQKGVPIPDIIMDKPVKEISLNMLWGVALP